LIAAATASNFYALGTAATAPARYFNRADKIGTVEVGKQADLVLLDSNPLDNVSNVRKIAGVVLRGEWLSASDLRGRLKRVGKRSE